MHLTRELAEELERIATGVIAEHASAVDREARFPKEAIAALARAGLLGVLSAKEVGGAGLGLGAAAEVVERVARACGSTAMIVCMHLSGAAVVEKHGPEAVRRAAATGGALLTLAFSEAGSRSMFWAPTSTATRDGQGVRLEARKSFVTSASHADHYVWSSKPVAAAGEASTLWLVPRGTKGLTLE
ncbi:MAG TPA: acyl-CoA dehydrogenase family protein, partial [Minicystis sp.]|nr:acyl-CoA dehydrogenase family protein [Minicystis sp.]